DEALLVDDLSQAKLSRETADAFAASEIPETFDLHQNFPNPFNPETSIRYQLPEAGWVRLRIYNILGEEIALLQDGEVEAGHHRITWNGKDRNGQQVASGIYLYRLEVQAVNGERFASTKKMNLLR
ncbi:MAG: FlgD immunoglobulin-like domain containing protein, partial [bacterium]